MTLTESPSGQRHSLSACSAFNTSPPNRSPDGALCSSPLSGEPGLDFSRVGRQEVLTAWLRKAMLVKSLESCNSIIIRLHEAEYAFSRLNENVLWPFVMPLMAFYPPGKRTSCGSISRNSKLAPCPLLPGGYTTNSIVTVPVVDRIYWSHGCEKPC